MLGYNVTQKAAPENNNTYFEAKNGETVNLLLRNESAQAKINQLLDSSAHKANIGKTVLSAASPSPHVVPMKKKPT